MALPRRSPLIRGVDTEDARLERLVRRARSPGRLAPLVRALGMTWAGDPRAGAGADEGGHPQPRVIGRRPGWAMLLVELDGEPEPETLAALAGRLRDRNPVMLQLFLFATPGYRRFVLATFGLDGRLRQLAIDRLRPRRSELEALEELRAAAGEDGVALAARYGRALDRGRMTSRFFREFKAVRAAVAAGWSGIGADLAAEREQLALLLLCRLMFLYFLQRDGHLAGDGAYLHNLLRNWASEDGATFFRRRLQPLFFGALNTRPEARDRAAAWLRGLPYLNGGLFERHGLERRFPDIDLPDAIAVRIFGDLLERYRFTSRESAGAGEAAVDPEMLGRVFEGLMAPDRRGRTGTFFTPSPLVDRIVATALAAHLQGNGGVTARVAGQLVAGQPVPHMHASVRQRLAKEVGGLRVLDPACGSGAFLVGALARITRARAALTDGAAPGEGAPGDRPGEPAASRDVVARALFGVDVQEDAALLCALRLWLALAVAGGAAGRPDRTLEPLPNLDRRIRQGDALLDPLDLVRTGSDGRGGAPIPPPARVLRLAREVERLSLRYLDAGPEDRPMLKEALARAEEGLARDWLEWSAARLAHHDRELRAAAADRDLFGDAPAEAVRADSRLREVRDRRAELEAVRRVLEERKALPFFSFGVHFAEAAGAGFDIVLSNPPWVRSHRWPAAVGRRIRERFEVARRAGWRRGAALIGAPGGVAAQVDLSLLFLERSLGLLRPGGTLAMVLPAKVFRSLYGAGARRLLLRAAVPIRVEDHALDSRSLFDADAFAGVVVARRRAGAGVQPPAPREAPVEIVITRRSRPPLSFTLAAHDLPVLAGDVESPWLLAPPAARAALRRMQAAGPHLGALYRPRRGVVTGANDVLVFPRVVPRLGGLATARAEGWLRARRDGAALGRAARYQALLEAAVLTPLVRGADVRAWRYRSSVHLLWCHDDATGAPIAAPPRCAAYLARHRDVLRARSGWRPGLPIGAVFRVTRATMAPKVAWRDLSTTLEAVALPARHPRAAGRGRPLIPLNTVYFIATDSQDDALLLAALLNSLPARVFTRAIAERAKDQRFRFFAWTVALLPLPPGWMRGPAAGRVLDLARAAHAAGALNPGQKRELDGAAAAAYGLTGEDVRALAEFDAWLGEAEP